MDQEEVHAAHAWESCTHLHGDFFLRAGISFLTSDFDIATCSRSSALVLKRSCQRLISARDYLVHGEFTATNIVVSLNVGKVVHIINIVNFNLVLLALLEVILHIEGFDPRGIQVVHDHLSHSDALPLSSNLLVEENDAVRPSKCIQVRQIFAGETQADRLDEATLTSIDALIDGRKDSIVQVTSNAALSLDSPSVLVSAHARHAITNCSSHFFLFF
jgi:hypothetical protein